MKPFDLRGLRTYDLASRPSKVFVEDLGRPLEAGATVSEWLDAMPRQLAGLELRKLRDHLVRARRAGPPGIAAIGGHVIKTRGGPYLIDWGERGFLARVG